MVDFPRDKAYGLFNCKASIEEIERSLRDISEYVQAPQETELRLRTMDDFVSDARSPKELIDLIDKAHVYAVFPKSMRQEKINAKPIRARSLKYVIEATSKNSDNETVARTVGDVTNGIHQMYGQGREFEGTIVYKKGSNYVELD